ncbi:MAG: DMT family transporter [Candidatus Thermoplasmatota archaeon]|nr:DMT family transporter [Candidatus Thermoplasmatota archaeon]
MESKSKQFPPALILVIGVTAISTASTFIRLAQNEIDSVAIAAWRLAIASLLLAPFGVPACIREIRKLNGKEIALLLASGIILGFHFMAWVSSLSMVSVASSVVLVTTAPLFVAAISFIFLKEKITKWAIVGILVAMAGSAVIGLGDIGGGKDSIIGDLLALAGAITAAIYFIIGKRLRPKLSLMGYVFPVYAIAAILVMSVALFSGAQLSGYANKTWLWLFLLAILPQIVGHSSLNWALAYMSPVYVTMSVLAEPVGSVILAWLVLGEAPPAMAIVGGILIFAGILVGSRQSKT